MILSQGRAHFFRLSALRLKKDHSKETRLGTYRSRFLLEKSNAVRQFNIEDKVFIKLVVEKKSQRVLGLHYIGDHAAEIIQGFSVAVVKGLKKADFEKTIGIHPSSAEEIVTI